MEIVVMKVVSNIYCSAGRRNGILYYLPVPWILVPR